MPVLTDVPAYGMQRRHRSARYYSPYAIGTQGVGQFTQGTCRLMPFWVPEAAVYDRVACEVTTAGESGSVVRMGGYLADPDHLSPLAVAPLFDAGVVAADVTGMQEITISQLLPKGLVWIAAATQLCPTTAPFLRSCSPANGIYPGEAAAVAFLGSAGCWGSPGITGALPVAAYTFGASTSIYRVWLRRA